MDSLTIPTVSVTPFDYTVFESTIAKMAMVTAQKVREHQRRATADIIDIGGELLKVKEALGHGIFGAWLDAECGWTDRTARSYMRAAEVFGAKSETISVLPPTTVYKLASKSTPADVVERVVTRLEAGQQLEPSVIEAEIDTAKHTLRRERKQAKAGARRQQSKSRRQRLEREKAAELLRKDAAEIEARRKVDELVAEFGADAVIRIARALDDWDVRMAVADVARKFEDEHPDKAVGGA